MNDYTKRQKGSPSRDKFKWLHKQIMPPQCWALNSDLELVEKSPVPFIVARLDFKLYGDSISFTEAISYQQFVSELGIPVYIIIADRNFKFDVVDHTKHRFDVWQMTSADYRPNPPTWKGHIVLKDATWDDLKNWEIQLRNQRKQEKALTAGAFSVTLESDRVQPEL